MRTSPSECADRARVLSPERRPEPRDRGLDVRRVDVVGGVGLVVLDVQPARLEQLARTAGEADLHHRGAPAGGDEDAQAAAILERRLPAPYDRDEYPEREEARRPRPVGAEPERVGHHRAHQEAPQHGRLGGCPGALPQLVVEAGKALVRGAPRVRVRVADARHHVPVVAGPARKLQRRARRDDVEPPARVEHVGEAEQVVLVGAAAVVEDEQAGRLAVGGGAIAEHEIGQPQTSCAVSTISRSLSACCSRESALPSTVEEKPHCGERHSWSMSTYCVASSIRRLSSSLDSSSPRLVVTRPSTTVLPLGTKRSGSKPPERASSHSMKKPSTSRLLKSASATKS